MEKEKGGGSFLAGLLVGAAVGALISTKRGRQILKDLSDYGLEYVGKAVTFDDLNTILNEEEEDAASFTKSSDENVDDEISTTTVKETEVEEESATEPSRRKRLFKGIKK